jgi:hypothetical protein
LLLKLVEEELRGTPFNGAPNHGQTTIYAASAVFQQSVECGLLLAGYAMQEAGIY